MLDNTNQGGIAIVSAASIPPRKNHGNTTSFLTARSKLPEALKILGYSGLRAGQDRACNHLFGKNDTICVLPTGGGKSAIYIVPSICLGLRTLIFSPLVSLMQDQLESLWRFNLAAGQISSAQTESENRSTLMQWEVGDIQFLLVAPERLDNDRFMEVMTRARPSFVVVDEAHCMSNWAQSFRPAYKQIGDFVATIQPEMILALTATMTKEIETDVRDILRIPEAHKIVFYPKRDNLELSSRPWKNERDLLREINKIEGSVIVYCLTRQRCEDLYRIIGYDITGGANVYHGGMTADERASNQTAFMRDDVRVMFATNAFGMGIDKPNIRGVIHRDRPGSVESLAQEQGRAGRDGLPSYCLVLEDKDAERTSRWMIDTEYPARDIIERVFYNLQKYKDVNSQVQMTLDVLAEKIGLNLKAVSSAVGILTANNIISRGRDAEQPFKVKILKEHLDPKQQWIIDQIKKLGMHLGDGVYEVNMSFFLLETKMAKKKLTDTLKNLDANAYLQYTAPFRGSTTQILGDLSLLDFNKLDIKRADAYRKLDAVSAFLETPDHQKHDYLLRYFGAPPAV